MKVNRVGIFIDKKIKNYPIGKLEIIKGETKDSYITIYKEYIKGMLDLKYYLIKSKIGQMFRSRLKHINNGKTVWQVDR